MNHQYEKGTTKTLKPRQRRQHNEHPLVFQTKRLNQHTIKKKQQRPQPKNNKIQKIQVKLKQHHKTIPGKSPSRPTSPLSGSRRPGPGWPTRAVPATALTIRGHRRRRAQHWPAERPSGLLAPCEPTLWPRLSMGWSTTNWAGDWKYTESEYYELTSHLQGYCNLTLQHNCITHQNYPESAQLDMVTKWCYLRGKYSFWKSPCDILFWSSVQLQRLWSYIVLMIYLRMANGRWRSSQGVQGLGGLFARPSESRWIRHGSPGKPPVKIGDLDVSENGVPLNPMVNDHYPY